MVNIDRFNRPIGKTDEISVYLGNKEIPISSFTATFAFDAFSHSFQISTPAKIPQFTNEEIEIYLGDTLIFTGLIFQNQPDGTNFNISGKSLTSVLERSANSPTAVAYTYRDISPLELAQSFSGRSGIEFTSNSPAAHKKINQYEASDTATAADVIMGICKENSLFVAANAEDNTAELKHLQSIGNKIFSLDTASPNIPFENLNVEFNSAALYSNYIGISDADENKLTTISERVLPQAPFYASKIVKPAKNQDVETALDSEITKSLIAATKISFTLPFIVFNGKIIKPYDTFSLTAKKHLLENREFTITDIAYSVSANELKSTITACLSSALFGVWE